MKSHTDMETDFHISPLGNISMALASYQHCSYEQQTLYSDIKSYNHQATYTVKMNFYLTSSLQLMRQEPVNCVSRSP